jgi:DNA-binding transcriptional ArsR family regulator
LRIYVGPVEVDEQVLRAVAHPLRRRVLDLLRVHGPQTATALASATDQRVANLSHHLKVLAACGLVGEAPELARDRRERWWRIEQPSISWSTSDFAEEPGPASAARAAESLGLARQVDLVRQWAADPRSRAAPWADAAFATDSWMRLTPQELAALSAELQEVLDRYRGRPADGREPVFVLARGFPATP